MERNVGQRCFGRIRNVFLPNACDGRRRKHDSGDKKNGADQMRMKTSVSFSGIVVLTAVLCLPVVGQNLVVKKFGAKDSLQKFSSNTSLEQVIQGGKVLSAMSVDENQKVNVIVELSTPVVFHSKGIAVSNRAASSQQRSTFVNRVLSISSTAKILHQFSQIINGVSLNAA